MAGDTNNNVGQEGVNILCQPKLAANALHLLV